MWYDIHIWTICADSLIYFFFFIFIFFIALKQSRHVCVQWLARQLNKHGNHWQSSPAPTPCSHLYVEIRGCCWPGPLVKCTIWLHGTGTSSWVDFHHLRHSVQLYANLNNYRNPRVDDKRQRWQRSTISHGSISHRASGKRFRLNLWH